MKKGKAKKEAMDNETNVTDNLTAEESVKENTADNISGNGEKDHAANFETQTAGLYTQADVDTQIAEWKDKYLRLSAEFDNYRKRTLKEKADLIKFAGEDILKALLPVVDDFERARKNLDQVSDVEAIKEGVNLIYNKFKDFISQKGLKEIDTTNGEFNVDFHEAITRVPVEDKTKSGKIIDVIEKGYVLDEKVVRYTKVVLGE